MARLILASNNAHKISELKAMLATLHIELTVVPLNELDSNIPEIVENGKTFEENATIKVQTIANVAPNDYILADDSGLSVDALAGQPGVYSARYAGDHDDEANIDKVLTKLSGEKNRTAHFNSVLVLIDNHGRRLVANGQVDGQITTARRGNNGFGYDPIFFVPQFDKTFAELTAEEKNHVSHRGLALKSLGQQLPDWLKG
ncbi:XTP/dITP diphosphatase [Leuconostoc citreum]|uniref:XTP/dITP diphosphatase n=1 Tax=Leuconostoc citreum TaxID=33964 RepID=UPI0032DEE002